MNFKIKIKIKIFKLMFFEYNYYNIFLIDDDKNKKMH